MSGWNISRDDLVGSNLDLQLLNQNDLAEQRVEIQRVTEVTQERIQETRELIGSSQRVLSEVDANIEKTKSVLRSVAYRNKILNIALLSIPIFSLLTAIFFFLRKNYFLKI